MDVSGRFLRFGMVLRVLLPRWLGLRTTRELRERFSRGRRAETSLLLMCVRR
jgi:hypothetical protein